MTNKENRTFEEIVNFFVPEEDWNPSQVEDKPILNLDYDGRDGQWKCLAIAEETISFKKMIFYSIAPFYIQQNRQQDVAEFLHRINCSIDVGNFELNFDTKEVRCRTSVEVIKDSINSNLIYCVVENNIDMMGKYLGGIIAVNEGRLLPEEAEERGRVEYPNWE
ncbi:MAG: hypothetical protein QNJ54_03150 [Prochloraceae cyanobacterium]|nr:hypothetical protein [Prochloraceae cyanobacterium]